MRGCRTSRRPVARRGGGFTLLESLVAASLIGMVVLAVISGITAAQRVSFDGQQRILAALAADDLMLEITSLPYADLDAYDGLTQAPGALQSLDGAAYPGTFWSLGRDVSVVPVEAFEPALGVVVRGRQIEISVRDQTSELLSITSFIPEPAS